MTLSHLDQAESLLAAGRAAEALMAAEMGLGRQPDDPRLQALRDSALVVIGAFEPAFAALQLDAAVNADKPAAHLELGHAYVERALWADAERCFRQARMLDPASVEAEASLGLVYLNTGMKEAASNSPRASSTEARVWLATTCASSSARAARLCCSAASFMPVLR